MGSLEELLTALRDLRAHAEPLGFRRAFDDVIALASRLRCVEVHGVTEAMVQAGVSLWMWGGGPAKAGYVAEIYAAMDRARVAEAGGSKGREAVCDLPSTTQEQRRRHCIDTLGMSPESLGDDEIPCEVFLVSGRKLTNAEKSHALSIKLPQSQGGETLTSAAGEWTREAAPVAGLYSVSIRSRVYVENFEAGEEAGLPEYLMRWSIPIQLPPPPEEPT